MLRRVVLSFTLFCLASQPVLAAGPIVADGNAAPGQRPTVQTTANGLPIVNIAAPNGAGVSHNKYDQFNVEAKGAILNNAQGLTQTQLGGYVDGNANLAGGAARTILNEVTSGNPSALRGYLEVAGQRANVIVANPNGITCDGCGFINSNRATLTTGMPVFGGSGSLDAFRVTSGLITVGGAGFNGNNLDQVDLIARAVQINAGVYARQLNVIAGANRINYADMAVQALAADANAPGVSIDVAQLGGMYADKIRLVGTEAGVGVNSAGTLAANQDLQIDSAGRLTLGGKTNAATVAVNAQRDVVNSGQLYATQGLNVAVAGALTNTGVLASGQNLTAQVGSLTQQGTLAAGLSAEGQLQGAGALVVNSSGTVRLAGQTVSAGNMAVQAAAVDASGGTLQSAAALDVRATQGDLKFDNATVSAAGGLNANAGGTLGTRAATLSAQQIALAGQNVDNSGGKLIQTGAGTMQITAANTLTNQGGLIGSAGTLQLNAARIDNSQQGQLQADRLALTVGQLNNQSGSIRQMGTQNGSFAISGVLDNRNGSIATNATDLSLAAGQINNAGGQIVLAGNGQLSLAGPIDNSGGKLTSNGATRIDATTLVNNGGQISAQHQLVVGSQTLSNRSGTLIAGDALRIDNAGLLDASDGAIEAGNGLTLNSGTLTNNGKGRIAVLAGDGTVSADVVNNQGTLGGNGKLQVNAGQLNNSGTLTGVQALGIKADRFENSGKTATAGALTLNALDTSNGGVVQGEQVVINGASLTNAGGQLVQTGSTASNWMLSGLVDNRGGVISSAAQSQGLSSGQLDNTDGQIGLTGNGQMRISGATVNNTRGRLIQSGAGSLEVTANTDVVNQGGLIASAGQLQVQGATLDNSQQGQLQADRFALTVGQWNNQSGTLRQTGVQNGSFAISGLLDNRNGSIGSNAADLSLAASQINNAGGQIALAGTGKLSISGPLDNNGGKLVSNGDVAVNAATLNNVGGQIVAQRQLQVTTQSINNRAGSLASGDALAITNDGALDSTDGNIEAGNRLTLNTGSLNNGGRVVAVAGNATVTATGNIINTGTLGANGQLQLNGKQLNNSGTLTSMQDLGIAAETLSNSGTVVAAKQVTFNATQSVGNSGTVQAERLAITTPALSNSGGKFIQTGTINGAWTIASLLDNRNGSISSAAQDLALQSARILNGSGRIAHAGTGLLSLNGTLDNAAGQIGGNGAIRISTDQFGNVAGNVAAYRGLTVTAQNLNNTAGGVLTASDTVDLGVSGTLDNTGGTVEGGNGLSANAATLNNGANGRLVAVNGDSRISAGSQLNNAGLIGGNGNVTVTAPQLNNTGTISAGQLLDVSGNELGNRGGQLQGRSVAVRANGKLDNAGGKIDAANALSATAATIDNAGGRIGNSGGAQTTVSAGAGLNNSNGLIGGNGNTQISAATLTNTSGTLTSGADLGVTATTQLNNGGGTLFAVGNTSVSTPTFNNAGGVLNGRGDASISAGQTDNSGGRIATNRNITLTSAGFYGLGNINAGNDLTLNLQGDINLVAGMGWTANHDLTLNTNGNIDNRTRFGAVGTLSLNGANVYNRAGAELSGNDGLRISTGYLQNDGTLFGDRVELGAGSILNRNAIFGGDVTLRAGGIANTGNGNPDSSIIAAGRNLNLYTNDLTNTAGGDLYSLGNLNIAAQDGVGNAWRVLNQSSTIQGDGSVSIRAGELRNQWDSIAYSESTTSTTPVTKQSTTETKKDEGAFHSTTTTTTTTTTFTTTTDAGVTTSGRMGKILAGGQMTLAGGNVINDASVIAAGGNASVDQNLLQNVGYQAYHRVTETKSGTVSSIEEWWAGGNGSGGSGGNGINPSSSAFGPITTVIEDVLLPGISASFTAGGSISGNAGTIRNITTGLHTPAVVGSTINANGVARFDATAVNAGGGQAVAIAAPTALTGQGPTAQGAVGGQALNLPNVGSDAAVALNGQATMTQGRVVGVGLRGDPVGTGYQLPTSGLYRVNPQPGQKYLIETDPRFTQYGQFISSDYMLGRLNIDPAATHKRLGDAFYENKLITDQIAQLTGRRFLDGYTDQQTEYRALMDAGAAYAQQFGIVPGISLSGDQLASLTRDMVWLETRIVDGQSVLVPVVYLAGVEQNVMQSGQAMLSAGSIDLRTGTLTNSGVIQSQTSTKIAATQISNLGGSITSAGSIDLAATGDLLNQSGLISGNAVKLVAGNDLTNLTIAGMQMGTIQAGDSLVMGAGRDLSVLGGKLDVTGDARLQAGRDLNIGTASETTVTAVYGTAIGNGWYKQDGAKGTITETVHQGSQINIGGSLSMTAANDATVTGSQIKAGENLALVAGNNVTIKASVDTSDLQQGYDRGNKKLNHTETGEQLTGSKLSAGENIVIGAGQADGKTGNLNVTSSTVRSDEGKITLAATGDVNIGAQTQTVTETTDSYNKSKGFLGSSEERKHDSETVTQSVGSTISGDSIKITSGNNLSIAGSNVVATNDIALQAKNDITITAVADTHSIEHVDETRNSGMFSSNNGVTFGSQSIANGMAQNSVVFKGSMVGSTDGNVSITAGGDARIIGSELFAGKDLDLSGQNVLITAAESSDSFSQWQKVSQSGLSIGVVSPILAALMAAKDNLQQAGETDDSRLKAVKVAQAGMNAWQAYSASDSATGSGAGKAPEASVQFRISYGASQSESESQGSTTTNQGSKLTAGGNLNISATGKDGEAGTGNLNVIGSQLNGNNVTLYANNDVNIVSAVDTQQHTSSNSSSGWDVGVGFSVGQTTGWVISASGYMARGETAGDGNTHIQSKVVAGDTLTVISGRDTTVSGGTLKGNTVVADVGRDLTMTSQQNDEHYSSKQESASAGVSFTFGYSAGNGTSANASYSQSTIDSAYRSVQEQTGIYAGSGGFDVIVGNHTQLNGAVIASTAGKDKNSLDTGTLGWGNLHNEAEYDAKSISIGVGTSGGSITGMAQGDKSSGDTKAAVADGSITIRNKDAQQQDVASLSRDTENANGAIDKIFNLKKVQDQQEIAAGMAQLAAIPAAQVSKWIGDTFSDTDPAKYAAHAALGAAFAVLTGGNVSSGALGGMLGEALPQLLANAFEKNADGSVKNPALFSAATQVLAALTASGLGMDVGTAGATAKNAVENNYLNHQDSTNRSKIERQLAKGDLKPEERAKLESQLQALNFKDLMSDAALLSACQGDKAASEGCGAQREKAKAALQSFASYRTYSETPESIWSEAGQVKELLQATTKEAQEAAKLQQLKAQFLQDYWGLSETAAKNTVKALELGSITLNSLVALAADAKINGTNTSPAAPKAKPTMSPVDGEMVGNAQSVSSVPSAKTSTGILGIAAQWKDPNVKANQFEIKMEGKVYKADSSMDPNGVPVFNGASSQQIRDFAWNLMQSIGAKDFPVAVNQGGVTRYTFKDPETGASITLRDFSSSANSTGAKWTIDINKHPDFSTSGGKISKAELKFR